MFKQQRMLRLSREAGIVVKCAINTIRDWGMQLQQTKFFYEEVATTIKSHHDF